MISAPPATAPYPVEKFLSLEVKETSTRLLACLSDANAARCEVDVRIGIFFDGTNNNLNRDRNGERIQVESGNRSTKVFKKTRTQMGPGEYSHSNVARLFQTYTQTRMSEGRYSYYIPGVGTPFDEIGEPSESSEGKAFAKGGQARIIFALLQVVNSAYATLSEETLYSDAEMGQFAQNYEKLSRSAGADTQRSSKASPLISFFSEHIQKLSSAITARPKPVIPFITLDVFGFSRGAAQAVAFCHYLNDLLISGKLASIPVKVDFLGVFDTVASVGLSSSVSMTLPVPNALADGHFAWAARILDPLPECVVAGRHFIAAHEQRMNFPLTSLSGPDSFKEVYFPGVHSDVGGGYAPGDSGKGRGGQAHMLSQIPLAFMYKEARKLGVPLRAFGDLEQAVKDDFLISAELAASWNVYRAALIENGMDKGNLLKQHMKLFYLWRSARLESLHLTRSFSAADPQAQQDLLDSNRLLKGDLRVLKMRASRTHVDEPPIFSQEEAREISQWQLIRAANPLDNWERWALQWFENSPALASEVLTFFDDYVHDSIAGFYLAGEVTEYDKRVKVAAVIKMRAEKMNKFDKRIYLLTSRVNDAIARKEKGETLSAEDEALVTEAKRGTPYPLMTDEDTRDMANPMIYTQTSTRREGGGYFLMRGYYPREGMLFRKFIRHKELDRAQRAKPTTSGATEVAYEAVWSKNIRGDVRADVIAAHIDVPREFA